MSAMLLSILRNDVQELASESSMQQLNDSRRLYQACAGVPSGFRAARSIDPAAREALRMNTALQVLEREAMLSKESLPAERASFDLMGFPRAGRA